LARQTYDVACNLCKAMYESGGNFRFSILIFFIIDIVNLPLFANVRISFPHISIDYPSLRVLLCMGGISMAEQSEVLRRGIHIVVATPGRLQDMLEKKKFSLLNCKLVQLLSFRLF